MTRYHASRKYCSWLVAFILVLILTLTVVGCSDGKSQDDTQVTDIGRGSETEDEEVETVEVAPSTNAETEIPTQDTAIPAEVKLRVELPILPAWASLRLWNVRSRVRRAGL